jgi:hypothetical protein
MSAAPHALKINRCFTLTDVDDPNTMLRLIEFIDTWSRLRAHRWSV